MRTTDLFKNNRTAKKINESLQKTFGKKLNLESFDLPKLEDARNKLRTQIHDARSQSGFNETLENEALTQAQWMLDAINSELAERQEFVSNSQVDEGADFNEQEVLKTLERFEKDLNEIGGYGDINYDQVLSALRDGDIEAAVESVWYAFADQDGGEIRQIDKYIEQLEDDLNFIVNGSNNEGIEEGYSEYQDMFDDWMNSEDAPYKDMAGDDNAVMQKAAEYLAGRVPDHEISDIAEILTGMFHGEGDNEGGETDDSYAMASAGYGSDEDYGDFPESIEEKAPPGAKAERMVKHIKKGYAKDGKLTDKEKSIAYATAWKQHNKESVETGDEMTKLHEGEIQQASAIVTAKTMVDRVGRWIEELSGMENDTLLQLGDSIRDEMGQEQAKQFISSCAPAIQQALQNLKDTREALASSVRTLTGEESAASMLGAEPAPVGGIDDLAGPAEPDAMNAEPELDLGDEFAAAEPAAGPDEAGRAKRESIERGNSLLKVLAG